MLFIYPKKKISNLIFWDCLNIQKISLAYLNRNIGLLVENLFNFVSSFEMDEPARISPRRKSHSYSFALDTGFI